MIPSKPAEPSCKSLDYSWHSGFLFSLNNYRWWLGRKVSLGAAKWRGIGNDFHRSSVYRNDGKLAKRPPSLDPHIQPNFSSPQQPENSLSSYDPHGFLVIYSCADRSSFLIAERSLQTLWTSENIAQKAVILVANKSDLARSRCVTTEGSYINSNWIILKLKVVNCAKGLVVYYVHGFDLNRWKCTLLQPFANSCKHFAHFKLFLGFL